MKKQRKTRGSRRGVCLLLCLLFLLPFLLQPTAAFGDTEEGQTALNPVGKNANYSAVLYDNTNGLPTSESNDIAQTSEGFIWIGSYGGLLRYDGHTFERMDSTTGVASVVCLHVDSQDRLWIGTNDTGMALMERDSFRMWGEDDGLGSSRVCEINEDGHGNIYAGTASGVTMITEDLTLHPVEDPRISDVYVETMSMGSDGLLYVLTNEDVFFSLLDGQVVDYFDRVGDIQNLAWIYADPDIPGALYIGTQGSELYYGDPKQDPEGMAVYDISPLAYVSGVKRIGEQTWVSARNGVGVLDAQGFHDLPDLPMNNSIKHVMVDYEGNLWFTSTRQGVMKLVSNPFIDIFHRYDLPSRVVNTTCMSDGLLFIGTDTGLLVIDEDGLVPSVPLRSAQSASGEKLEDTDLVTMLDGQRIRSILPDSKGRLWISTWRTIGLLCYDHGDLTVYSEDDGLLSNRIRAVRETPDGSIAVACTGGACVIKDGRVVKSYGRDDGIVNQETLTVEVAFNGDILLGSDGGGIYVLTPEGTKAIGMKEGLTSGVVMRIKHDEARDIFWIVTSNSIGYLTSDYEVVTIQKFPYSNNFDMYENSKGDMWILSSNGIYVLPSEELVANGEITPVHYGIANGLPTIATSNSYSELTADGDLYISGRSGVAKINIESSLEDINDLKQAVPFLEADGVRIYPDESGVFTVPSDMQKLTVYSYVFNYSLTDPHVSYYLEGFDREPVTVSRSELGPISYTNLPGGSYRFVMELKDAMDRGSQTLYVTIVKEKALYEHAGFYVLISFLALLLLGALIRFYVRRKMLALEEKHREEAERERISNELQMANQIQMSMLPHDFPPFPDRKEFDIYATMTPAREVGGDFYDFFLVDDDHLCLVIADVSGKGIPAALYMMISKAILQGFANLGESAAEIFTRVNEALYANNQEDMFVTVWLGILEISTGKLTAANAGHEYPVLKQADGRFHVVKDTHNFIIGGLEGMKYKEYELHLEPGAKLFLYTDGVPESTNTENEMFGMNRLIPTLDASADQAPEQILKNVLSAVDSFVKDAEQFDDLTMLCLEYKGPRGSADPPLNESKNSDLSNVNKEK